MDADDPHLNVFSDSPHKAPNHVLINEYLPGQGIMPHKDGSAYHPVVCTVSLGGSLCLDIYGSNENGGTESGPRWKILQEPRSLLITTGEMYTNYLHGIADVAEDTNLNSETVANWDLLQYPQLLKGGVNERQSRTSLTYRDVLKVSKLGRKLGLFSTKA
jgi:alkylated DNA repair protein alkB homolog 6